MDNSLKRVQAVATLARLDLTQGLSPEEAEATLNRFASQFKDIVALMDTLSEVNTEGVDPLYWPLAVPSAPPREDVAHKACSRQEVLANAPDQDGRFFIVPRIV